jgi:type III secretion protein T
MQYDLLDMTGSQLLALGDAFDDLFLLMSLCSIRLLAAFLILPATGDQFMQGLVRAAFIVMLASYVAFGMPHPDMSTLSPLQWLGLAGKEALIGFSLGFAAATVFWTAECVGALLDTQTGYNAVELANPMSGQSSTPLSNLLLHLTVAVFYILGGLLAFIGALFQSFKIWPLMSPLPSLSGTAETFVVQQTDALMTAVLKFAAPVLLVLVLIDLGFGLVTRAASRLEPSSLSQPVKAAVALLMLSLLVGVFLEQVRRFLLPTDLLPRLQSLLPS